MISTPRGLHTDCFLEFGDRSILVVDRDSPKACHQKGGGIKVIVMGEWVLLRENSRDEYEGDIALWSDQTQ
jgi:hypothetical protein